METSSSKYLPQLLFDPLDQLDRKGYNDQLDRKGYRVMYDRLDQSDPLDEEIC
jgi:hypothetical protein